MPGLSGNLTRSNKTSDLPDDVVSALEQGLALQIANKGQSEALAGISTGMTEFQKEKTAILDQFAVLYNSLSTLIQVRLGFVIA